MCGNCRRTLVFNYLDSGSHGQCGLHVGAISAGKRERGVHWEFREGKKTWYAIVFREEEDGLHYYLERPILRIKLFDFDHKHYNQSGDALFNHWLEDDTSEDAVYFGLGEDAVLLWKEGEEVNLPAATDAQEELWALAELPPQEVP